VDAEVGRVLNLAVGGGTHRIPNGCQLLVEQQSLYLGGGGKTVVAGVVYC
jgi:hypothetical protein